MTAPAASPTTEPTAVPSTEPSGAPVTAPEAGRFITFEGIDGAGKSTHIAATVARLRAQGREVVETREPGGTALAENLRNLLLHQAMSLHTELLLMFAARRDHLDQLIRPALARGAWVVCDRFTDSTYAYQGGGRQMGFAPVAQLEHLVHPDLQPDQTFYFDLEPATAAARRAQARAADRFEAEDLAFFERVRAAYLQRAREQPRRFVIIDASRSVAEVADAVASRLLPGLASASQVGP